MIKESLNGLWKLSWERMPCEEIPGAIPGSVYSFLQDAGLMEDPYYRDNELKALPLMERDYVFTKAFDAPEIITESLRQVLRFDGIDTVADIYLNDVLLGHADNMHCTWEYEVAGILRLHDNLLRVHLSSPTKYIQKKDAQHHLGGSYESMRGFPHLRKAHFMFGWDWGPRLPDQGIWRDVSLIGWNEARIADIRIHQELRTPEGLLINEADDGWKAARSGDVEVKLTVSVSMEEGPQSAGSEKIFDDRSGCLQIRLISPSGEEMQLQNGVPFSVPNPQLWWPHGLGGQPLYQVEAVYFETGDLSTPADDPIASDTPADNIASVPAADRIVRRIGLRSVTVQRRPDKWGETFAMKVNGRTFFAMGADYIPEDNILAHRSREKTEDLLQMCADAGFNVIRVWGGGLYPEDDFYDLCDEKGLLVWQDLMFACANYKITPSYVESITREIAQNVRRLRHHASLGLWCGNNEMEQFALEGEYEGTDETRTDYLIQNEYIIPEILRREDPDTFYWPSSPSSGGKFDDPRDENRGDVHYWDVWHGNAPFTAYRSYFFRFLSEFGFQSFPCMDTIRSFTLPQDRNVFSYVMEMHQRNGGAGGKILQYLSQNYLYPGSLELLVYASQLLQADAIRYGVYLIFINLQKRSNKLRYYIADCHFFHESLNRQMDCRGFADAQEMNAYMIEQWNKKVRWNDEVVILGDFSVGKAEETNRVLEQLNGFLYLIEGNHDRFGHAKGYNAARFKWIRPYAELRDNSRKVILCHYPILCYNGQYLFDEEGNPRTYMLYGHVHDTWDQRLMEQALALARQQDRTRRDGTPYKLPCQMINCFCMYSDYTPLSLDEWIEVDRKRQQTPSDRRRSNGAP